MAELVAAQTLQEDGEVLLARLGACGGHVAQTGAEWRLYNAAGAARPQGTVSPDLVRLLEARGHLVARAGGGLEPRVLAQARTAAARFTGRCEVQARGRARLPAINAAESPLGWLRAHKGAGGRALISVEQFMAGEQLRADHERACLAPRVTANWDELAAAGRGRRGAQAMAEVSDGAIAARRKVQAALAAVGPELASLLVQICCLSAGMEQAERLLDLPARSGRAILGLALTSLARHYGYIANSRSAGIAGWGLDDYRPAIPPVAL